MYFNEQIYSSPDVEESAVVKSAPGKVYSAICHNTGADAYFQVWDGDPASGGLLRTIVLVPAAATGSVDFGSRGAPFHTNIRLALSTTPTTFTGATALAWFTAIYS